MVDSRQTYKRGWDSGYVVAMNDVNEILDELGAPREANGATLYVRERIAALKASDGVKDTR